MWRTDGGGAVESDDRLCGSGGGGEAGATVIKQYDDGHGVPDHVLMADPEGNEFCVL
jgi:hypothetical protein